MSVSRLVAWCYIFFFKQKTAYDMRIRDWSSDVCSSDLQQRQIGRQRFGRIGRNVQPQQRKQRHPDIGLAAGTIDQAGRGDDLAASRFDRADRLARTEPGGDDVFHHQHRLARLQPEATTQFEYALRPLHEHGIDTERGRHFIADDHPAHRRRSEEHTSELQSLMRISYAVFCWKKKKITKPNHEQYKMYSN